MRELELIQENMEYQRLLTEKKLLGSSVKIVDNVTDAVKDWVFEWGTSLVLHLIRGDKKHEDKKEAESD
ncbi:hypothetical protein [Maribellus mangrovi]|uniref:hypothetical protein n=1 Tax=Maribellus mangrovi TaxID=3133146 RepID=UPI0030EDE504